MHLALQGLRTFLVVMIKRGCSWHIVEARNIAKYLTMHKTAPRQQQNDPSPNVSNAEAENLWITICSNDQGRLRNYFSLEQKFISTL